MNFSLFSKPKTLRTVLLATTILGFTVPAAIAEDDASKAVQSIRQAFQKQYGQRFDTGRLIKYLNQLFRAVDFDRAGLNKKEIVLYGKIQGAQRRARVASRVLRFDLDGDGIVTRAEVETSFLARRSRYGRLGNRILTSRTKRRVDKVFFGDPNHDGRIEPSEYGALSKAGNYSRYTSRRDHSGAATALLKADPNKDGVLTQIEAMGLISKAFYGVKIKPLPRRGLRSRASCNAPKAAANAKVVAIGAYKGSGLSTVTIAGQDKETSTSKIIIEEGKDPLYLVMTSSRPMIWRFSGATDRISHVIVAGRKFAGQKIQAGVTGVAKDKVSFLSARGCINYFYKLTGIKGARIKAQVGALTGRSPDKIAGHRTLHDLRVPSGAHAKPGNGGSGNTLTITKGDTVMEILTENKNSQVKIIKTPTKDSGLKRILLRYNPSGIVKIDAKSVVSNVQAVDYEVLPQEAGLLQLMANGTLEVISRGEFRIVKKMRYPGGMTGGHSKRFLLKKGVPEPTGHPGHSCVFSEDKAGYIAGRCR